MDAALRVVVERLLDGRVANASRARRGYTPAERWVVRLDDGRGAFVKAAVNEMTADWLRRERHVYASLHEPFVPHLLGWEPAPRPVLVLEDLSGEHWPPPWRAGDVALVQDTLGRLHATQPPAGLPALPELFQADGWATVADDPARFLATRLAGTAWLDAALPALLEAERAYPLGGDALLHLDVRSDNLCLRPPSAVLVDWNHACVGNRELDVAFWLPSLEVESGGRPEETLPHAPGAAAVVAGYFAARAGLGPVRGAPGVRPIQLAQLRPALGWAARALGLAPPRAH